MGAKHLDHDYVTRDATITRTSKIGNITYSNAIINSNMNDEWVIVKRGPI